MKYSANIFLIFQSSILLYRTGNLGTVVQSIVSLTSSLVIKMLTVLVSTIPNSHVFLLKISE